MEEYKIERFSLEKMEDFLWLFEKSFDIKPNRDTFFKKFDTNYTGSSFIAFIAYDKENQPAAFYGVFPCLYNLNGKVILGAQSGDTMTHPQHRKKGLFYKLAKKTYELALKEGIKYIYGVPNGNSYHGFKKMGWQTPYIISEFEKAIEPSLKSKLLRRASKTFYENEINAKMLHRDSKSPVLCARKGLFTIERNQGYHKYKKYNKNYVLNFENGKAWLSYKKVDLVIGDYHLFPDCSTKAMFLELELFAKSIGCSKIIIYNNSSSSDFLKLASDLNYKEVNQCHVIVLNQGLELSEHLSITATDFDTF